MSVQCLSRIEAVLIRFIWADKSKDKDVRLWTGHCTDPTRPDCKGMCQIFLRVFSHISICVLVYVPIYNVLTECFGVSLGVLDIFADTLLTEQIYSPSEYILILFHEFCFEVVINTHL